LKPEEPNQDNISSSGEGGQRRLVRGWWQRGRQQKKWNKNSTMKNIISSRGNDGGQRQQLSNPTNQELSDYSGGEGGGEGRQGDSCDTKLTSGFSAWKSLFDSRNDD
jgi:hypothetical protein